MSTYPQLIINQSAIQHNIEKIRSQINNDTLLMGVIKADAYGLGAEQITKLFISNQIDYLAVARVGEAKLLAGLNLPIPVLIFEPMILYKELDSKFEYTITDISILKKLIGTRQKISIQIKVNTGMNRLGMSKIDLYRSLDLLKGSRIKLTGIYTHFAAADDTGNPSCEKQILLFSEIYSDLKHSYQDCLFHASNSAAIFNYKQAHFDMVRSGIAIYGSYPTANKIDSWGLKPVCKLISRIIQIKDVKVDEYVGYSGTYRLQKDSKIAIVQIGYADGYNRHLSNNGMVRIAKKFYPVIGQISMDLVTIEIGSANLKIGDHVELISDMANSPNTLESIATKNKTIPYEILTSFTNRVTRIYK